MVVVGIFVGIGGGLVLGMYLIDFYVRYYRFVYLEFCVDFLMIIWVFFISFGMVIGGVIVSIVKVMRLMFVEVFCVVVLFVFLVGWVEWVGIYW